MARPSYYAIECRAKVAPTPFAEDRWPPCCFFCVCVAHMIERLPLTAKYGLFPSMLVLVQCNCVWIRGSEIFDGPLREHLSCHLLLYSYKRATPVPELTIA